MVACTGVLCVAAGQREGESLRGGPMGKGLLRGLEGPRGQDTQLTAASLPCRERHRQRQRRRERGHP